MEEIDPLLEKYEPGNPKMKPDVLKQIAQIEKEREKMIQEEMAKSGQIMLNQPGKPPVPMTMQQIAELLTKQGEQIQVYERRIAELEGINGNLQKLLIEKSGLKDNSLPSTLQSMNAVYGPTPLSKSEPLFKLDPSMI